MAIELISTITTKNNGGYAIAYSNDIKGGLHSKATLKERDMISPQRLQEGMLCYVLEDKSYYQWKDEKWIEFTVSGGGGNGEDILFRVDTYLDMLNINALDLKNGYLCHVTNDTNGHFLYYYSNGEWKHFNSKHQVWIGNTPPDDKTCLWVDTSNMVIDGNPGDITIDNYPTFIDTSLIQYLKEQILGLNNKIKDLKNQLNEAIKNGGIGGGNGGNGGNSGGTTTIVTNDTYFITEEGEYFVTEDGNFIITEDSAVDNYTPDEEGVVSGGNSITTNGTYLTSEDGTYFITEDGNFIMTEDSLVDNYTPDDEGTIINGGNNSGNNGGNNNNNYEKEEIEDVAYSVKGGRYTTSRENEEIVSAPIEQVTIFNESQGEINLIINGGEVIPLEVGESLSFGDIIIESIVVVEKGSIVKYIGI